MWEFDPPKDECRLSYRALDTLMRIAGKVLGTMPPSKSDTYIIDEKLRSAACAEGGEALNVYLRGVRDGKLCPRCGKNMTGIHPTYMCPRGFSE